MSAELSCSPASSSTRDGEDSHDAEYRVLGPFVKEGLEWGGKRFTSSIRRGGPIICGASARAGSWNSPIARIAERVLPVGGRRVLIEAPSSLVELVPTTNLELANLSECRDCLRAVLVRPAPAEVGPVHAPRSHRRRDRLAAVAGAMAVAVLVAWATSGLRAGKEKEASVRAYMTELESTRARMSARLERLKRELEAARATPSPREQEVAQERTTLPPAGSTTPSPAIRYADDRMSLNFANVALREVLDEIGRQSGAVVRGQLSLDREVTVSSSPCRCATRSIASSADETSCWSTISGIGRASSRC